MQRTPESRISVDLPVRIWGMDADGKPFFQNATASSLSSEGATLSRILHTLKVGEIIGVQYGERKARFAIKWAKMVGAPPTLEVGVRLLPNQITPWTDVTSGKTATAELKPHSDKRKFVRHKVSFPITISFTDARRAHMQCYATDIGGRGCYVESLVPLNVGTAVQITFWIDSEKIITKGVVRTSDPAVGMGIEFTALESEIQQRLQEYLAKMDKGFASAASPTD
jgi:PilZ domain